MVLAGAASSTWAERSTQDGAFADDFVEAEFGADFFLEIKFFDGELVFERVDFLESEGIFDGDGDLRSDLAKQFDVGRGKILQITAGEIDGAKGAAVGGQRDATDNLNTLLRGDSARRPDGSDRFPRRAR